MEGFAEVLRWARQRTGISQSELARRVRVTPSYINRLERGERDAPTLAVVDRLADALQLSDLDADRLRMAAGYLPRSLRSLVLVDPTLALVADVLFDEGIPGEEREDFREIIRRAARRWRPSA